MPSFIKSKKKRDRLSPASKLGLKYQKEVQNALCREFSDSKYRLYTNQWFEYFDEYNISRFCEMDAFLISPGQKKLYLFEIKYKHSEIAYYQLHNLYMPVIRAWKPGITIHPIELVRWYDSSTPYPTSITLCRYPLLSSANNFNVKIWNPEAKRLIC